MSWVLRSSTQRRDWSLPEGPSVIGRAPDVFNATVHCVCGSVAVHELTPSLTLTTPLGAAPDPVTLKLTTTPCPLSDGSGEMATIAVEDAASTECATADDALCRFQPSPVKVAVSIRVPIVFSVTAQLPALAGAVQELTPSDTVTGPTGAAPPACVGVTVKPTVTAPPTPDGVGECEVSVVVVL